MTTKDNARAEIVDIRIVRDLDVRRAKTLAQTIHFLDAAAGDGLVCNGIDAADLYSDALMALGIEDSDDIGIATTEVIDNPDSFTIIDRFERLHHATPPASAGEVVSITDELIRCIQAYGGRCRDCADEDGSCPTTGIACGESEKAIRWVLGALNYGASRGYISALRSASSRHEGVSDDIEMSAITSVIKYGDTPSAQMTPKLRRQVWQVGMACLDYRIAELQRATPAPERPEPVELPCTGNVIDAVQRLLEQGRAVIDADGYLRSAALTLPANAGAGDSGEAVGPLLQGLREIPNIMHARLQMPNQREPEYVIGQSLRNRVEAVLAALSPAAGREGENKACADALTRMVAIDEEIEASNPGYMDGEIGK